MTDFEMEKKGRTDFDWHRESQVPSCRGTRVRSHTVLIEGRNFIATFWVEQSGETARKTNARKDK
jgi:hypothetical protein